MKTIKAVSTLVSLYLAIFLLGGVMMNTVLAMPVHLQFDPAIEGGFPTLTLSPIEDEADTEIYLRSYYLDENDNEVNLDEKTVVISDQYLYTLPVRDQKDIVGMRVEHVTESGNELLREWRALYLPEEKVMDYQGSDDLKRPWTYRWYWRSAKKQLAKIPMNAEIVHIPERDTETGRLYRVKLNSYDNTPIVNWYFVPRDVDIFSDEPPENTYPAVQIMPGWGAEQPPWDRTAEGFITLSVNPRSHGPSKEYFESPVPHHLWNIDDHKNYYYRAAYMDCLRSIDFLASRPEVDAQRIGVEGGSQGGAFALAMAALDERVACAVANVPYISNFPDYVRISTLGSGQQFGERMNDPETGKKVRRTLSYIDVALMAPFIQCPTMITVGLQDRVTPPVNGIVAYNRIPDNVPKVFVPDPEADHEITPLMREENMRWHKKYLMAEENKTD